MTADRTPAHRRIGRGAGRALRAAALALAPLAAGPAAQAAEMSLHLVLAFDASASVNDVEFALQREGTAAAFRDPEVRAAIAAAPGGVAVAVVQWSSIGRQAVGLDWRRLRDHAGAEAYAAEIDAMPRRLPGGGTMIHAGLAFAAEMLGRAPGTARRRVIDLSGNGASDDHEATLETRDRLVADGLVINGLAIEEDDDRLTAYFRQNLIGGPGAFVLTASDFDAFAEAMRLKLLREIRPPQRIAAAPGRGERGRGGTARSAIPAAASDLRSVGGSTAAALRTGR